MVVSTWTSGVGPKQSDHQHRCAFFHSQYKVKLKGPLCLTKFSVIREYNLQ
ncbi:rCG63333 [Rattus norvegicus]|uniref:RCG63333 n=1 Tax=Rattus norvegicus TaxID=10116 RepID=A6JQ02_RAT|nr:rCG63333 [Rattus norvegicus]